MLLRLWWLCERRVLLRDVGMRKWRRWRWRWWGRGCGILLLCASVGMGVSGVGVVGVVGYVLLRALLGGGERIGVAILLKR